MARTRKLVGTGRPEMTRYPLWHKIKYKVARKKDSLGRWLLARARMGAAQQAIVDVLAEPRRVMSLENIYRTLDAQSYVFSRLAIIRAARALERKGYITRSK